MDKARKYAYRFLLYQGLLAIRANAAASPNPLWNWVPAGLWNRRNRWCQTRHIADALHNLALFSALEFEGFDELHFWRELEALEAKGYASLVQGFRRLFQFALIEAQTGKWPSLQEQEQLAPAAAGLG